jgi:AacA4 family aminoglycoside N(6')-acetyltransferase
MNDASSSTGTIRFRPLALGDLAMLHDWLNRAHVVEWWGGDDERPTLEQTIAKYAPRVFAEDRVSPFIALLDARPIGYTQSYVAMKSGDGWWEDVTDPGVRGIDQFLCNAHELGQGLGTRMVSAFVDKLFEDARVTRIQTDPMPTNTRAIRCYEKAGFQRTREVDTPDGRALLMHRVRRAIDRPN